MEFSSLPLVGIALALCSALALSIGNLWQGHGVRLMEARVARGTDESKVVQLIRNRFWLLGSLVLVVSILLQLGSLTFAPLMVVQPIGVAALVFTVLLTSFIAKRKPAAAVVRSILICVLGVAVFVTVAALVSTQHAITNVQLVSVLIVLGVVLLVTAIALLAGRTRTIPPLAWVILGGTYSAFVATLGKTVITRVQALLHTRQFALDLANLLTIGCVIGIGIAGALSIYFVQRAHAFSRPEVVVAGLTVIDPAIAVVLGITILGEASGASIWAIITFVVAGAVAVGGVFALAKAESASAPMS
ncbi:multidrug DMT transporter permease [Microbacterium sp.]|uniref:multidrug DMT transporter permease n=1 Tax=Microbacterium sp. TaxID=51671 RepID=UPI003F94BD69